MIDKPSLKKRVIVLAILFVPFVVASGLLAGEGRLISSLVTIVLLGVWLAQKSGKLRISHLLFLRTLNFFLLTAIFATAASFKTHHDARIERELALEAESIKTSALSLIAQNKLGEAKAALHKISVSENAHSIEAKRLLSVLNILTSSEIAQEEIMKFTKDQFDLFLAKKPVSLDTNPDINAQLNERYQLLAPQVRSVFNKVKSEETKKEKALAAEKRKQDRRLAAFGEAPTPNPWDGSYSEVKDFLKSHAKDPDSIKISGCTPARIDEKAGWVVGCDYRGKNSFGGYVKNSNWFIIKHGIVVKSLPANSYR